MSYMYYLCHCRGQQPNAVHLPATYDHVQQRLGCADGTKIAQTRVTYSETQTFDYRGRPFDSDND